MAETSSPPPRVRKLIRVLPILCVVLFVALLAFGLSRQAPDETIETALADRRVVPAPGFELPRLQRGEPGQRLDARLAPALADGEVGLAELRGSPVVLNFWASWCVPCREEAPRLERAWHDSRDDGVIFVGLNMQDVTDDAREFMREFDVSYLNVRDQSDAVARGWGLTGIPETFFIRRDGGVVAHVVGAISREQLSEGIAAADSGRPLGSLEGGDRRGTR